MLDFEKAPKINLYGDVDFVRAEYYDALLAAYKSLKLREELRKSIALDGKEDSYERHL